MNGSRMTNGSIVQQSKSYNNGSSRTFGSNGAVIKPRRKSIVAGSRDPSPLKSNGAVPNGGVLEDISDGAAPGDSREKVDETSATAAAVTSPALKLKSAAEVKTASASEEGNKSTSRTHDRGGRRTTSQGPPPHAPSTGQSK